MRLNLEINNCAKIRLNKRVIHRVVLITLKKSKINFLSDKNILISLAAVTEEEIKKLNQRYRKINEATDILSFSEYENLICLKREKKRNIFLGEIVICPDYIKKFVLLKKLVYREELVKIICHGVLHLLSFEHGKKMSKIQNSLALALANEKNDDF